MSVFDQANTETPTPPAPKGKRKCSVCGEVGHTARRHGGTPGAKPGRKSQKDTRARNINDFLTIPAGGLAIAGRMTNSAPLVADAIVISHAGPTIADAVANLAEQDDRIAGIVDRIVQTGPYAALFSALLPVAVQLAANHSTKIAEAGSILGVVTAEEIIRLEEQRTRRLEEETRQAEEAEARMAAA